MSLISRQEAIDNLFELNIEHRVSWLDAVADMLDDLPDAIVQCKDCKNANFDGLHGGRCYCMRHGVYFYEDDFCSHAELR